MRRPSPAMAVATTALVLSAAGTAGADATSAISKLINGNKIKPHTITAKQIKSRSLTAGLFKPGQLRAGPTGPAGPKGDTGPAGPKGDTGATGPAGTPDGYTKTQADANFLGKTAKAADADRWDGIDSAVLGTAVTVPGAAFVPIDSSTFTETYLNFAVIQSTSNNANAYAPLDLPQGATITGIRVGFLDNDGANDIEVRIGATNALAVGDGAVGALFDSGSLGQSATFQTGTAAVGPNAVVDNTQYGYFLRVHFDGNAPANLSLSNVRVSYTLPTG